MKNKYTNAVAKISAIALVVVAFGFPSLAVQAASLTSLSDNMTRLAENTASDHDIRFVTPSGGGVAAGETITLTFSADFDLATNTVAFGDIDFAEGSSNDCTTATWTEKTLAGTPSGTTWGAAISGQVLTITSGSDTVTADRCVRILIGTNASGGANRIVNGPEDDDDTIAIAGTFGDTGTITVDIIADDTVDITATVNQSISFTISDNDIEFGTLSSGAAKYADNAAGDTSEVEAHTLTAGTNATSGYIIYVSGATLTSGSDTITAIGGTNTASSPGSEQFGIRFTASGGSGTVSAPYAAAGFAYDGASAADEVASSTGPSATTTYSARYLANIAALTEAGSYSTTLTYTATATY
ncbi:MAG: hypothetical protein R3B41_00685 [Candidatus Doudnabacteria bacterium]